jgi:hypothetical protein
MADEMTGSVIREIVDELYPVIDHAKFAQRFMRDVIDEYAETQCVAPEIRGDYETMFNDEYRHFTYRLAILVSLLLDRHARPTGTGTSDQI